MLEQEFEGMLESGGLGDIDRTSAQYIEMRRCFFAGAKSMHSFMEQVGELPEEQAYVALSAIGTELEVFAIDVAQGRK